MYDRPHRRRGLDVAAPRARPDLPADLHVGPRSEFLRRHEREASRAARDPARRSELLRQLATRTADLRNLTLAWDYLATHGGAAPGADGITFADVSSRDRWATLHALQKALQAGHYRPGPARTVKIPKRTGGTRTLTLPAIPDRVVGRALLQVLQPYLDPLFLDTSFGYRPRVGATNAVATAAAETRRGRRVWVTADIRQAFDRVPIKRLLDVVQYHLPDPRLVKLIRSVIDTPGGQGLRQGCPLSPLLLNLYLHHHLDVPWQTRSPGTVLLRYADDLLLLAETAGEARSALDYLTVRCRSIGLPLKEATEPTRDLRGDATARWLGYQFCSGAKDQVRIHADVGTMDRLGDHLIQVIQEPGGYARTRDVILGWVDALGPTHGHDSPERIHAEIRRITVALDIDGSPSCEEIAQRHRRAGERFRRVLEANMSHEMGTARGKEAVKR